MQLLILLLVIAGSVVYIYSRSKSNKTTLKEALSDKVPQKYMPHEEDALFLTFYSKLMKQIYSEFTLDGFEYLYIYLILDEIKNNEDDLELLTDFYRTNHNYDFNNFDIKQDQKDMFSHEKGVGERVLLYTCLRPFLKFRENLIKIKVSDINTIYDNNLKSLPKAQKLYDDSKKRNSDEFMSKSSSIINTIRIENKLFSYAKEILNKEASAPIPLENSPKKTDEPLHGTLFEVINKIQNDDNPFQKIDCDDNIICTQYAKLLKKRTSPLVNAPYHNTYFNIILSILKEKEPDFLDNYLMTNSYFKIGLYDEETDEQYFQNDTNLYTDPNYAMSGYAESKNVDSKDNRRAALAARIEARDFFLPFISIYNKVCEMDVNDVRKTIKSDRIYLNHNSKFNDEHYKEVEAEYEILIHFYHSFKCIFSRINDFIDAGSIQAALNTLIPINSKQYSIEDNNIITMYSKILERRGIKYVSCGFELYYTHFLFNRSLKNTESYKEFLRTNKYFNFNKYNETKDEIYRKSPSGLWDDPDYDPELSDEVTEKLTLDDLNYVAGNDMDDALMDRSFIHDILLQYINLHDELADIQLKDIQQLIKQNESKIRMFSKAMDNLAKNPTKKASVFRADGYTLVNMSYESVRKIREVINKYALINDFLTRCDKLIPNTYST